MDSDYLDFIHLIEEYKSHSENADAEIAMLRRKCDRAEAESAHSIALLREMEDNVIYMDQEMSALRKLVTERDDEIITLQFELQQAKRNEKVTAGSGSLQLSTAKEESRVLRIANERLREQIDELEYTLNRQQSLLIESNCADPGAMNLLSSEKRSTATISTRNISSPESSPKIPSPIKLTSVDILMGDTEVSEPEHVGSSARQESSVSLDRMVRSPRKLTIASKIKSGEKTSIAKEAAYAAIERENSVRPIVNRRDGSFGLSPSRIKSPPSSIEKWAYAPQELTNYSKFCRPTAQLPQDQTGEILTKNQLPIQSTELPEQDNKNIIKIFDFSDLNDDDKFITKALRNGPGAKDMDSDEDIRHVRLGYAHNSDIQDKCSIAENEVMHKERSYYSSSRSEADASSDFQRSFKNPKGKTLRA
jgi:hypothetical protein